MNPGFFGDRLRIAREYRMWSRTELAERVVASQAMISYLERGARVPRDNLTQALADVLGFRPTFFLEPVVDEFKEAECNFRSASGVAKASRRRVLAHGTLLGMLLTHLRAQQALPPLDVPYHPVTSDQDIEDAANATRRAWGLDPDAPIGTVGRVVEHHGVPLTEIAMDTEHVDAFSRFREGGETLISMNSARDSASRASFSVAHELGHLVMHRGLADDSTRREHEAHRFASAFLMPRAAFSREFWGETVDWSLISELKQYWGTSMAAIVRRAFDLALISAVDYRRANQHIRKRGWYRDEPFEPPPLEPEMLRYAVESATSLRGHSLSALAISLHWHVDTLCAIAGLPASAGDDSIVSIAARRSPRTPLA